MTLAEYLESRGISKSDFAKQVGVAPASMTRYVAGRVPDPDVMMRIYKASRGHVAPNDFYQLAGVL